MSEILLVNPRRRRRSTKKKTAVRRRRRRRNPVTVNPAKRRRVRRRRASPSARRRVRRRRSNPAFRASAIKGQVKTATTGALGALGLDIALAYIPLPAAITGGMVGKLTKAAGAIALGVVANKVGVSAANANRMAEGALTVQLHGLAKELLGQFAPGVNLSGMGYYGSGWNPNYEFASDKLGAYLPSFGNDRVGIDSTGLGAYMATQGAPAGYDEY